MTSPFPTRPPAYLEYYPRFDIVAALAARRRGSDVCEFRTQRQHWLAGQLIIAEYRSAQTITIDFCGGLPFPHIGGSSTAELRIDGDSQEEDPGGRSEALLCPTCNGRRFVLWYKCRWGCARCHKLLHRSQVIDPLARRAERVERLEKQVKPGRPAGMRRASFAKLRAQLAELRDDLEKRRAARGNDAPLDISADHQLILVARWLRARDIEGFAFPNYRVSAGRLERVSEETNQ